MNKYIELSYTIEEELAAHPYDDELKLYRNRFLDKDKYNDTRLETGMHVGTHIDAPSHLTDSDVLVDDYPAEKFIGKGCLIDVRDQEIISLKKEYVDMVEENDIVLLYTGYDKRFGSNEYFNNHPIISKELALFLVDKKIKMVGMDIPSPDRYPFEIHKILLGNDILIIENLRNLGELFKIDNFEIIALPLKIKAEGAQVRVVARGE